jgi:hypothetical protein
LVRPRAIDLGQQRLAPAGVISSVRWRLSATSSLRLM